MDSSSNKRIKKHKQRDKKRERLGTEGRSWVCPVYTEGSGKRECSGVHRQYLPSGGTWWGRRGEVGVSTLINLTQNPLQDTRGAQPRRPETPILFTIRTGARKRPHYCTQREDGTHAHTQRLQLPTKFSFKGNT